MMQHTHRCGLLLALAVVLLGLPTCITAGTVVLRPYPDLIPQQVPNKALWLQLGQIMWDRLTSIDFDFVDANGQVVPLGYPGATVRTPTVCGSIAKNWILMPYHDCATYDCHTGKGGCNGSLRKELQGPVPLMDFQGHVIYNNVFDEFNSTGQRARVDQEVAFDPTRTENIGYAVSTSYFYTVKFAAEKFGLVASWADIMVFAGHLSVYMCDGPKIVFVPGRIDSRKADGHNLIPSLDDPVSVLLGSHRRMGMSPLETVLMQSMHTTDCIQGGCLDKTADKFDSEWATELLSLVKSDGTIDQSTLCKTPSTTPPVQPSVSEPTQTSAATPPQATCTVPADLGLLGCGATKDALKLLTSHLTTRSQLTKAIGHCKALVGFRGLLWKVNLCGDSECNTSQYAFHQLFATAYYRLTSLGLSKSWPGNSWAVTGPVVRPHDSKSVGQVTGTEPIYAEETDAVLAERAHSWSLLRPAQD